MSLPKLLFLVCEDWHFCAYRLPLAIAAQKAGYDVYVATTLGKHQNQIVEANLKIRPLKISRRSFNPFSNIRSFYQIFRLYQTLKPDVVHHLGFKPIVYGSLCAALIKLPKIVNALAGIRHLIEGKGIKDRLLSTLMRGLIKLSMKSSKASIIVQNPEDYGYMAEMIARKKLQLIPGPSIDTDLFAPSPEPQSLPLKIVMVSRMVWSKGVGDLVEALKILRHEGIKIHLKLVGAIDRTQNDYIPKSILEKWIHEGLVTWETYTPNLVQTYQEAHAVVLPSRRKEGIAKSLVAAASCGKPIITTDLPGFRDVVTNEVNGLLVPTQNPIAIAAALKLLASSPALRKKMSKNAREIAIREFGFEKTIEKTFKIYGLLSPATLPKVANQLSSVDLKAS